MMMIFFTRCQNQLTIGPMPCRNDRIVWPHAPCHPMDTHVPCRIQTGRPCLLALRWRCITRQKVDRICPRCVRMWALHGRVCECMLQAYTCCRSALVRALMCLCVRTCVQRAFCRDVFGCVLAGCNGLPLESGIDGHGGDGTGMTAPL